MSQLKEDDELGHVQRQQIDKQLLIKLRDEIAEVYNQVFLPEWESHSHVDWRIERLMNYMCWAITRQMGDEDKGWEETKELKQEFDRLFYYFPEAVREREAEDRKNADETVLPIEKDKPQYGYWPMIDGGPDSDDGDPDEIPF